ncbi:probable purine permease 11 [Gastrolobium bilobum]|uniref:probable purine permease 11 n=1 Tax=Gastrolobium bilobum TaxID=150636 RepID=UPI002AB23CF9|nr:probable purine permease 11 [Gastrolobium bilobum]
MYSSEMTESGTTYTETQLLSNLNIKEHKRWFRVSLYTIFLLTGQSASTLLGRLYYDKGGNSKWMVTFVQSAGFPILLPFLYYFPPHEKFNNITINDSSKTKPKFPTLVSLYIAFGLLMTGNDLMNSYGLLYLPLSTYSLLYATELAFNALFSFFLNSQKLTAFIFNSIVLLTTSVALLAVNADSDKSKGLFREKHIIGFLCTLGASATFSLYLSLVQLSFEKVVKKKTFSAVLDMQLYPSFIATCACVVGLFASGEWKTLEKEMKEYEKGRVSYVMTLLWTAVTWQITSIGMLGLIFEVSSLFSIVISTLELPIVPIIAVMFFNDKINGVKVIALLLAIWGFLSYMYQHYLDEKKAKADKKSDSLEVSRGEGEIC